MNKTQKDLPKRYENHLLHVVLNQFVDFCRKASDITYGMLHSDSVEERIRYVARLMVERKFLSEHEDAIDALVDAEVAQIKQHFRDDLAGWKKRKAAKS